MRLLFKILIALGCILVALVIIIVGVLYSKNISRQKEKRKWKSRFNQLSMAMFKETYQTESIDSRYTNLGLLKDCVLILNAWRNLTFPKYFHVERLGGIKEHYEWFFPNLEYLGENDLERLKSKTVACKTREAFKCLKPKINARVIFTGFTSEDLYNSYYPKNYTKCLHIAGKSHLKGTLVLLDAWKHHPEWPTLTVVYTECENADKIEKMGKYLPNVELINRFVSHEELKKLTNSCGIHIYPCIAEGFSHTLNEVRAVKGVALYTNGGAMRELFQAPETGIPIEVVDDSESMGLTKLQKVSVKTIENAVEHTLSLPREQLTRIGENARLAFLKDKNFFKKAMVKHAFYCENNDFFQDISPSYGTMFSHQSTNLALCKIGIVMATFGRPEILDECLSSLTKSNLKDTAIVIVDESGTKLHPSETSKTHKIIGDFNPAVPVFKIFKRKHGNMYDSIKTGIDYLVKKGLKYFTILDSDTIVRPKWLENIQHIYHKIHGDFPKIVTGFNTAHHPTSYTHKDYCLKSSIGGINMFFNNDTYRNFIRPCLVNTKWDWNVCALIQSSRGMLIATKPSVVDHIGTYGINSSIKTYDKAIDFATKEPLKIDKKAAKDFCRQDTRGCSQWDQAGILSQIFNQIGTTNKFFVEFGARRPNILNSSYFRIHKGWKGLLLDGDLSGNGPNCKGKAEDVDKLSENDDSQKVILRQEFVTRENINQIFRKYGVPASFDLLTIDIDKNDYHVMDGLDTRKFSPRVVCLEFSSYFTKKQDCIPVYDPKAVWDGTSVTNSSLAALNRLMKKKNYSFVTHASGEHAIFVKNTELVKEDQNKEMPFLVEEGWQYEVRQTEQLQRFNPDDFECR